MTPEQQRIAIAESVGIYLHDGDHAPSNYTFVTDLPDFLNDRNAMVEAIASLPAHHRIAFGRNIQEILNIGLVGYIPNYPNDYKKIVSFLTAPVHLIAEAFLKTIGKWEGGSDE